MGWTSRLMERELPGKDLRYCDVCIATCQNTCSNESFELFGNHFYVGIVPGRSRAQYNGQVVKGGKLQVAFIGLD